MASKKNILDSFWWFLEKLKSNFVKKSGDTMTGPLTISKTEIKNNDAEPADKITVSLPKESGTLMIEPESVTKNTVYAGPSSADGKPEFRALTSDDIPEFKTLNFAHVSTVSSRTYISGQNLSSSYNNNTNTVRLTLTPHKIDKSGYGSIVLGRKTKTSSTIYNTRIIPSAASSIEIFLPGKGGTLALKSDIPDISLTGNNTFNGKNSFVSGWDAATGNEASSDYQLIIDCPIMESGSNNEYYSAIWFRDKNLTGDDYADKNTLCLLWNTNENCLSTYDRQTNKVFNLATESYVDTKSSNLTKQISELNAKMDLKGTYRANVPAIVAGNFVGFPFISIPNANLYNIEITEIAIFGGADKPHFGWNISKSKLGIGIETNNSDAAFYFGTTHPNRLWTLTIKIS